MTPVSGKETLSQTFATEVQKALWIIQAVVGKRYAHTKRLIDRS